VEDQLSLGLQPTCFCQLDVRSRCHPADSEMPSNPALLLRQLLANPAVDIFMYGIIRRPWPRLWKKMSRVEQQERLIPGGREWMAGTSPTGPALQ